MSESVAVVVPQTNPNDEHAVLVRWHVASGEHIASGATLATLETTKATFDVQAPSEGFAFYDIEPNTLVPVGSAIAHLTRDGQPPVRDMRQGMPERASRGGSSAARVAGATSAAAGSGDARFTRKALRLMRELGLSESQFSTSDRIDVAEVERVAREHPPARPASKESRVPLEQTPAKIIEARTLAEVYREVVPSTVTVPVSVEKSMASLQRMSKALGPVSLLERVIHESARVLADFPDLNGFYADGRAWCHETIAVGFAINIGKSLRVPVVRGTANLAQKAVVQAVRDLSLRYLRDELRLEDLADGTFTISDLSGLGAVHFVPVLNHRQAATLGICSERPGTRHFDLVLTFDHRISDGMRAAQFLSELRERLETDPTS